MSKLRVLSTWLLIGVLLAVVAFQLWPASAAVTELVEQGQVSLTSTAGMGSLQTDVEIETGSPIGGSLTIFEMVASVTGAMSYVTNPALYVTLTQKGTAISSNIERQATANTATLIGTFDQWIVLGLTISLCAVVLIARRQRGGLQLPSSMSYRLGVLKIPKYACV